ncbi:MAG: NYN domain-containing protein [Candidatus Omnitrophica bacterium]|nr:NYN domain-containing protein [Candidatus Omnitrophota bacterium]
MQTLIVDAYNVIHAIPELEEMLDESLQAARLALVRLLSDFKNSRKDIERVYIVFDGKGDMYDEQESAGSGITAFYTQKGKDADRKIMEIIKDSKDPAGITVVSNDNFVYNNSRSLGARIKTVKEFCRLLD